MITFKELIERNQSMKLKSKISSIEHAIKRYEKKGDIKTVEELKKQREQMINTLKKMSNVVVETFEMKPLDPSLVEKVVNIINKDFGKTNKLIRKNDPIWVDTDDTKEIFISVSKPPRGWLMKLVSTLEKAGMKEDILDTEYNELTFTNSNFNLSASKRGKIIELVIQRKIK